MLSQNAVTANTVKKEKKEFGISDKIGYMFGDLGNCFILGLVNSFLMIYYTNVLGVSGAIVGPTSSNDGEDCLYFCFIHCLWDFSLNNQYPVWSNGSSN